MKQRKALLIIDMQKGSFTPKTPRYDTEGVVMRINELAKLFRNLELPVVYIQHDGKGTGEFERNTLDWELLDSLIVEPSDILIDKYANDVFYNSKLQSKLSELESSELYMAGCATDFCIESTVQSAIAKDYNITVVSDGHTTAERPHLEAKKIIEHYNWVWSNMLPTKGNIQVKNFEEIQTDIATLLLNFK